MAKHSSVARVNRSSRLCRACCEVLASRTLLNAGDFDATFSGDGQTVLNFPGDAFVVADTAVAPDGKTVVGGTKGPNIALARLNIDGTLDTTFGNSGLFQSSRRSSLTSIAIQGDGKIIVGLGYEGDGFHPDLTIGRILENGDDFDTSFGGLGGIASVGFDEFRGSMINDVAVQRDGSIIGAGFIDDGILFADFDFAVVRYDANGQPDPTFDGDGVSVHGFGSDFEQVTAVTIDYNFNPDINPLYGTIVAVGADVSPDRFQVLRLRTDGTADSAFDGDGKLTAPNLSGAGVEEATAVAVQPGGKIVVAGTAIAVSDPNLQNFLIARFTSAGTLDTSFGLAGGGVTELDIDGGRDEVGDVAIGYLNTVGNLIVSGSSSNKMAMVALTPDGQLDTRFSGDGILKTTITGHATGLFATGSLIPPARKLVMAGGNGQVARLIDVGSLISVGTFQPNMYEQGSVGTAFIVGRTQALPYAETIFIGTSGTATPRGTSRDFNSTNILYGNGTTTTTQVTIPAGETTVTVTLTPIDDGLVEGDETITFFVNTGITYDASLTRSTTLVVRDNDTIGGPVVTASIFYFQTSPPTATITFNQSVVTTFTLGDLVVTGPGATPAYSLDYNNVTNTGTVVFYNGLADGDYTVRVKASGVSSVGGVPMAADYTFGFFVLAADINRDRTVGFDDLLIVAQNYGLSGRTYSQGNVDYSSDGNVSFDDLLLLAQRYGTSLVTADSATIGHSSKRRALESIIA